MEKRSLGLSGIIGKNGKGAESFFFLPKDPNVLLKMLDLSISSKEAGNTGVTRNYLVSILDELKRQGVLNTETYKEINSIIEKDLSN